MGSLEDAMVSFPTVDAVECSTFTFHSGSIPNRTANTVSRVDQIRGYTTLISQDSSHRGVPPTIYRHDCFPFSH